MRFCRSAIFTRWVRAKPRSPAACSTSEARHSAAFRNLPGPHGRPEQLADLIRDLPGTSVWTLTPGIRSRVVKQSLAIVVIVLALRLPFLHQAIQGDDRYYLYGAEHAQIEPLHPDHAKYLFQGDLVEMRGNSHPPLNSWILGALLWACGDVREVPFHLAYSLFSIIAALAMLSLARRFCDQPFLATLLFIAVPAFVVNGNSLEADLPFLAFWMLAIAWFVKGIDENSPVALIGSAIAAAFAALDAYQAVFLVPILAFYLWQKKNRTVLAWSAIFGAPVAIGAWQICGRISGGAMPATVLWDYMAKYGWQAAAQKVKNAAALTVHSAWIVSPLLIRGSRWNWILGAVAAAGGAFYDPNPMFWASLGLGVVVAVVVFPPRIPRSLGADLLRRIAGRFFRRIRPLSAADRGPHCDPRRESLRRADAQRRLRRADGAFARPHHRQLPDREPVPGIRALPRARSRAYARLGGSRFRIALLPGIGRRAGRPAHPYFRARRCGRLGNRAAHGPTHFVARDPPVDSSAPLLR